MIKEIIIIRDFGIPENHNLEQLENNKIDIYFELMKSLKKVSEH